MHILIETHSFERFTDDQLYAFCVANKRLDIKRNQKDGIKTSNKAKKVGQDGKILTYQSNSIT
jgi:uncharacterized ubiquitin-like protein YukD